VLLGSVAHYSSPHGCTRTLTPSRSWYSFYRPRKDGSLSQAISPGVELNRYGHDWTCTSVGALTNWASQAVVMLSDMTTVSLFTVLFRLNLIHLGYLRTDISGSVHASLFHLIIISLSFILFSFMPILFDWTFYRLWISGTSHAFVQLFRHVTSISHCGTSLLTSSRYHLIFSIAISFYFYGAHANVNVNW